MREMSAPVEVDKQFRVTIPPAIRKALKIERGDIIEIVVRKVNLPEDISISQNENPHEVLALAST